MNYNERQKEAHDNPTKITNPTKHLCTIENVITSSILETLASSQGEEKWLPAGSTQRMNTLLVNIQ
jgi:hypothetical protein